MPQPERPCLRFLKGWGDALPTAVMLAVEEKGASDDFTLGHAGPLRGAGSLWTPLQCFPCLRTLKKAPLTYFRVAFMKPKVSLSCLFSVFCDTEGPH